MSSMVRTWRRAMRRNPPERWHAKTGAPAWAIVVGCIALVAAGIVVARAAPSSLVVPGDLTVTDDVSVGDLMNVGTTLSAGTSMNAPDYTCPTIKQGIVFEWDEAAAQGKAYPDTICGVEKMPFFYAPVEGEIGDVFFCMNGNGSGWDSLTVTCYAGVGCDTTVFYKRPKLTSADSDLSVTTKNGRASVIEGGISSLEKGELVMLSAALDGSKADPPNGLKVWLLFYPQY